MREEGGETIEGVWYAKQGWGCNRAIEVAVGYKNIYEAKAISDK